MRSSFSGNKIWACALLLTAMSACKKFTEIGPPRDFLSSEEAFATDVSANATIANIYNTLTNGALVNQDATLSLALSADELTAVNPSQSQLQLEQNNLTIDNDNTAALWNAAYQVISQANVAIQGVTGATGITPEKKKQFIGEARFLRAFSYTYLVNLYGALPLVLDANWQDHQRIARTPADKVYQQIILDLKSAQDSLPDSYSSGTYIRATRWAATALLARIYLYDQQWAAAEAQATDVLENAGIYTGSLPAPEDVFLAGSEEAIWQLQPASYLSNPIESNLIAAYGAVNYALTDNLANAFEQGDLRKDAWVTETVSDDGSSILYPAKYKGDPYDQSSSEYYMMLRVGEQLLIRAEARTMLGNTAAAIADVNVIRQRAGLDDLPATLDKAGCLAAIAQERRIELLAEWGQRWLDLKRWPALSGATNAVRADEVLSLIKGANWQSTDVLYPVPAADLKLNPSLYPNNPGY
ncbi:SusD family protein [Chitinophaga costaii]|uniref:SusD family protein n=1 Tax=Chitinophaga costaii TaxID=1335309 RepID=A0A1C4FKE3_9BACT|nr:RagB/SusD family nutrient uptake outer membrane protein [Chitinophaga costaii]SCC56467.1 SusD family protein [Chitinophaga costaii]